MARIFVTGSADGLGKAAAGERDSIVAERQMDGYRTDHMGVSPDGRRLVVSDSTERQVIEYSMVDERRPDGTRIRMTESGFREMGWEVAVLEEHYRDHVTGWDRYMPALGAYIGTLAR